MIYTITVIICSAIFASLLGFLAGVRYQKGTQEIDAAIRDELGEKRAGRSGTVRLKSMKIRR